ncbi:zinc finger BED domain-containing protein 1-like [Rhizophagus irregularis DAOM 181602=DAOM 197198]|nr:zinc finger BED domain-containing protein 1-like [Rhizophagus irregularis DAOM 181602=DAOM 197198]
MVKKKGTVWKHWTIITEAESNEEGSRSKKKTHPSVRCNYCSKVFEQGTAKRMQVHLNDSCPRAPESAKTKKQQIPELLETSDATTSTFIPTVKTSKKHLKNTTIENFVDRMSEEEQDTLEILLAQALFAAGVPFSFLENNYVIQFFQQLRPAFKLPNRRKLADELLDDVFDEVKAECNEQILQAKSLTMVSDGWSNINRESVQNFVICTPKPLFFDAIYSGEESHTAKWVADEIIKQMEIVGINKFSAVITDTASVMKAAWRIIEDSYPSIVCLGCNSHVMNLLISDILKIDQIKSVVENAKKLVNYFKAHVQATAKLKHIQKENYSKEIALVLPALTRWGTHLACFQSLQNSRTALEQALMDIRIRQNMDLTLRAHILSDEFWEDLDIITKIMEPMVSALKLFESDISILSNVYSYFKEVMNQINQIDCNFSDKLQELIAKRWEYTYHPIMITAYMLDPQFLEKSKNDEVESIGYVEFTTFVNKRFNQEEAVELFAELVNFRNKNSPYDNEIIWKSANILNSSLWWQSWPTSKLQQLAIKILSIPTSSAAAERNFSTFGFIHNKIRNRLKNERVKKLVYIYGNLRMCNRLVKIQKKKQISNFNENEEDSNNSSDNENKEDDNNNSSDNDSIFGFEANVINLDDEE